MIRKSVVSSNIKSIGYDAKTNILEVEFNSGGIYQYNGVPSATHKDIMSSDSVGKSINILKKIYTAKKIG